MIDPASLELCVSIYALFVRLSPQSPIYIVEEIRIYTIQGMPLSLFSHEDANLVHIWKGTNEILTQKELEVFQLAMTAKAEPGMNVPHTLGNTISLTVRFPVTTESPSPSIVTLIRKGECADVGLGESQSATCALDQQDASADSKRGSKQCIEQQGRQLLSRQRHAGDEIFIGSRSIAK